MTTDAERLDWLEAAARSTGIFLYNGVDTQSERRTAVGLGLRPGAVDRNLREAIDQARGAAVAGHPIGERYRHFLNYGNLPDSPWLRYAYYHGAHVGLDRPAGEFPAPAARAGGAWKIQYELQTPWPTDVANPEGFEATGWTKGGVIPFIPVLGMELDCGDGDFRTVENVYWREEKPDEVAVYFEDETARPLSYWTRGGWATTDFEAAP